VGDTGIEPVTPAVWRQWQCLLACPSRSG